MVVVSPGYMSAAGVSEINLISLLYLFDGFNHWEAAMDGEFGSTLAATLEERAVTYDMMDSSKARCI